MFGSRNLVSKSSVGKVFKANRYTSLDFVSKHSVFEERFHCLYLVHVSSELDLNNTFQVLMHGDNGSDHKPASIKRNSRQEKHPGTALAWLI